MLHLHSASVLPSVSHAGHPFSQECGAGFSCGQKVNGVLLSEYKNKQATYKRSKRNVEIVISHSFSQRKKVYLGMSTRQQEQNLHPTALTARTMSGTGERSLVHV